MNMLSNVRLFPKIYGLGHFQDVSGTRFGILMKKYKSGLKEAAIRVCSQEEGGQEQAARNLVFGMFKAVFQIHRYAKIVHGDIAMRNFLVDKRETVIITDFGMSHKGNIY